MITRFALGNRYPIKKLGDLVQFLDNMRRPVTEADRNPGPYPYYGANGQQGVIDSYLFDEPLVLLAEDGGHFDSPERGIAYRISGKTWVNNHAHVLRPRSDVSIDYLCRVLENYDVKPWVTGTTRGKLTKSGASEIEIPLPPLPEQRRIAAILDKADALRAKRRVAIAKLDQLLQSVFLDMFATKKFETVELERLLPSSAGSIRTGPFGSQLLHSEFVDSGIAVLGIDNAVRNSFAWGKPRFITEQKFRELARYKVRAGDVLITIMGTCGRCAVVPDDIPVAINTKHLCCITLDRQKCEPEFLHSYFLMHPVALRFLADRAKGAIMSGLNMGIIRELPVELPPLEDQVKFVRLKKRLLRADAGASAHEQHVGRLMNALQQQAFSGAL